MKPQIFRGTGTAIVTPFTPDGSAVDYVALDKLIERQIAGGVEALVPLGSTGESATLTHEEKLSVVDFVVERAKGRVKIIAGAGGNDTLATTYLARELAGLGIDGLLVVTPFYNKPTPDGLLRHFASIANATPVPIILYNVPSRTGSNVAPEVIVHLAETIPSVAGVKEASGNVEQAMEIIRTRPEGFLVLSGEDSLTLPIVAAGGDGVIAVVSNEAPREFSDMTRAALAEDFSRARELHYSLLPLMHANFSESNPIPVKAALTMMGLISESLRLPLTPLSERHRATLSGLLAELGLQSNV